MKHNKIFIVISIVLFLFYLFIIYFTYSENKSYLLKNTKENQIKLVHAYKERFDEKLFALKRIVETMGKILVKKDRKKDFKIIKETLTNAMFSGSGFKSVYISYPDNFTISGRPDWYYTKDYEASKRPWYKEAIKNKKTIISKPYIGSSGFEDKIYISIASPIYIKNKLFAVISSDLELESVQNSLTSFLPFKKSFTFLMTDEGKVIVQSKNFNKNFLNDKIKKVLFSISNEKKGDKLLSLNSIRFILTYERLENSNWYFVSVLNQHEIYKDLDYQLLMNLLVSFFLFFLGLLTLFVITFTQKKLYEKHLLLAHFSKSPTWGVLLTDKNGNIIFINKVFETIFDLKSKYFYGLHLNEITSYLKIPNQKNISFFENLKNGPFEIKSYLLEIKEKKYRVQITPLLNKYQKKLEGIIITLNDVSHEIELEKKELEHEELLVQSSKMVALGEMVSAISHQWKQPLSVLFMLVSNMEELIKENKIDKLNSYLFKTKKNLYLMNETIDAFRNFYKEDSQKIEFDLKKIIEEIILINSFQMLINNIELQFIYDKDEKYVYKSYPSYIKQVLINLIVNAKDELSNVIKKDLDFRPIIKIILKKDKSNFFIIVEDNGNGILEKNKGKIFEPFFTTKGEKGTGRGLYICKLLIENKMKNKIILDNSLNPTRFIIKMENKNA